MKNILILMCLVFLLGCTNEGQSLKTYLEEPEWLIKDPHYASYQEKRDTLEHQFLEKDITYAQYTEQLKELDETYEKEVADRNEIVNPSQY